MIDLLVLLVIVSFFLYDGIEAKVCQRLLKKARSDWAELLIDVDQLAETAAMTWEYEKGKMLSMKLAAQRLDKHAFVMKRLHVGTPTEIENRFASTYKLSLGKHRECSN
ncbi:hypothetical protein SM033_00190 [Vibrio phage vB_VpaM_sm033]|nr:hypothetical protein SM033_00190 [Vibrio phage vB_VpaM_sm033]